MIYLILSLIICLLLILFFSPVYLRIRYDDRGLVVRLRLFYIVSVRILPRNKKSEELRKKDKAKEEKRKKEKDLSIIEKINPSLDLLTDIVKMIKKIIHSVRVTRLCVHANISGDDPADVAIMYGAANAAIYGFANYIYNMLRCKRPKIAVTSDYVAGESNFSADVVLCAYPIPLARGLLSFLFHGIINKNEEKISYRGGNNDGKPN